MKTVVRHNNRRLGDGMFIDHLGLELHLVGRLGFKACISVTFHTFALRLRMLLSLKRSPNVHRPRIYYRHEKKSATIC